MTPALILADMERSRFGHLINEPLVAVLIIGCLIRLVYLLQYHSSPEWGQLLVDSLYHDRWATAIASGDWVGREAYFRAPFYIYFLGLIYSIFGHSLLAARIAGHLIGLLSIICTFKITGRIFSERAAVIAGVMHALYPLAIFFESELLVEPLFTFFFEALVLSLLIAVGEKSWRWYAIAGLSAGLAVITRPVLLPLILAALGYVFVSNSGKKEWINFSLAFLVSMFIVILPVTVRNYVVSDDLVLVASSGGVNFYIGNNDRADGLSATVPEIGANWQIDDIRHIAERDAGHPLKPSELSDYWYQKGWAWIKADVGGFLKLYLKKLYFFFNSYEVSNNRDLTSLFANNPILRILPPNFGMVLSASIISLLFWGGARERRRELIFIASLILCFALVTALYFINARFRLPVLPLLFCLAAFGLEQTIAAVKNGQIIKSGTIVLAAAAVYIFSISNFYKIDMKNTDDALFNHGNYYLYTGELEKARDSFGELLENDPAFPEANLNLGATFLRLGMPDSAELYFRRELSISPANAKGLSNIATIYYLRNQYDSALTYAFRSIEERPYLIDGYLVMARVLGALRDTAGLEKLAAAGERNRSEANRLYLDAGLIFGEMRLYDRSEYYLKKALASPDSPVETDDKAFFYSSDAYDLGQVKLKAKAYYELGYIYGVQNLLPQSIQMSRQAIELDSTIVEAYINLVRGQLLSGDLTGGRRTLQIARTRFPQNTSVQAMWESMQ